jgi:hypothetical protein
MKDDHGSRSLRRGERARGLLGLVLALGLSLTTVMALAVFSVSTSVAQPTDCGNGVVDPSEDCDPSSPSGALCLPGEICAACTCTTCGNGTLDPGEDCDLSSPSGALVCDPGEICTPACECLATTTTTSTVTTTTDVAPPTTSTTLLNHFQCYEYKRARTASIPGVTVQDQFGSSTVTLTKRLRLCAPTNKNGEDPTAVTDEEHLNSYDDKHNRPKVLNREVTNQFGTLRLDVGRPAFLFVPAAKSLTTTPPAALTPPTPDHFQCYRVKRARSGPRFTKITGVSGADQFGSYTVDLLQPRYLCAPANKNGEDPTAPTHPEHLLCYKTRTQRFTQRTVSTTDQFGSRSDLLIRRIELCVPSLKDAGATTTTTSVAPPTTAPTTTVTTTSAPTTTVTTTTAPTTTVTTTTAPTTTVTTSSTTSSTTTTTLYGSPSRAFVEPVRSLLD